MTSYQLRLLAAFCRTEEFFRTTGVNLLTGPKNLDLIEELSRIIARLNELSPSQKRNPKAAKSNSSLIKAAADELRHELLKVARTSRALSDEEPELRSLFAMPRSPGHLALRRAAKAVLANTTPAIQKLFTEAELQADYLEIIAQKLQKFEFELGNKTDGRKLTSGATSEVGANFKRGMTVLRKLDAAVRNRVSDSIILDHWRIARSVELLHRPPPKYRSKILQKLAHSEVKKETAEPQGANSSVNATFSQPESDAAGNSSAKAEGAELPAQEQSTEMDVVGSFEEAAQDFPTETELADRVSASAAQPIEGPAVPVIASPKAARKPKVSKPIQDDLFAGF